MITKKKFDLIFLALYTLSSFYFFAPAIFEENSYRLFSITIVLVSILLTDINNIKTGKAIFKTPILLICLGIILSIYTSYQSWGQSLIFGFAGSLSYFVFYFYFYLIEKRPQIEQIEKLVISFFFIYILLYIIAYYFFPKILFIGRAANEGRGITRIMLKGQGFVYLGFFMFINKYQYTQKKIWIWYAIIAYIAIILMVTRQYLLASSILGFLFILQNLSIGKKIVLSIALGIIITFAITQIPIISKLIMLSEEQLEMNKKGEEDIRITSTKFFLFEFSPNITCSILGNGVPYSTSKYREFILKKNEDDGIYQSDVGFIGFYSMFGLISILGYILLYVKIIKQKIDSRIMYAKYFLFFVLATSFTSQTIMDNDYMIGIVFAIYLIDRSKLNTKINLIKSQFALNKQS